MRGNSLRRPLCAAIAISFGTLLAAASAAAEAALTADSPEVQQAVERGIAYLAANGTSDTRLGACARGNYPSEPQRKHRPSHGRPLRRGDPEGTRQPRPRQARRDKIRRLQHGTVDHLPRRSRSGETPRRRRVPAGVSAQNSETAWRLGLCEPADRRHLHDPVRRAGFVEGEEHWVRRPARLDRKGRRLADADPGPQRRIRLPGATRHGRTPRRSNRSPAEPHRRGAGKPLRVQRPAGRGQEARAPRRTEAAGHQGNRTGRGKSRRAEAQVQDRRPGPLCDRRPGQPVVRQELQGRRRPVQLLLPLRLRAVHELSGILRENRREKPAVVRRRRRVSAGEAGQRRKLVGRVRRRPRHGLRPAGPHARDEERIAIRRRPDDRRPRVA